MDFGAADKAEARNEERARIVRVRAPLWSLEDDFLGMTL